MFNVIDETTAELLAQPQHTNYLAYCILKNEAVFPFNLPFHQPIEAARVLLKYLGTSRYEVMDRFRATYEYVWTPTSPVLADTCDRRASSSLKPPSVRSDSSLQKFHAAVLERALDVEFLGLTQEEYIILTKEAFWPKSYFDVAQGANFTPEQYKQNIGVRDVWTYYGYPSADVMLDKPGDPDAGHTRLSAVKKQFLPRAGLQYTDLVDLLKTHYINPRYPHGVPLAILENIHASYRFLQSLVNTNSEDPKVRFAKLIAFLERNQSWRSVPEVAKAFRPASTKDGTARENRALRRWVYCCFEKLGKLIVLESGEGPQLPIEGDLVADGGGSVGKLQADGTIVDASGKPIGNVTVVTATYKADELKAIDQAGQFLGWVTDGDSKALIDGASITIAGPVKLLGGGSLHDVFGCDYLFIQKPHEYTQLSSTRVVWRNESVVFWGPPRDTCDLDKVRLLHLDGSAVTSEEFDRMQRFVRLWRKLGWTMDEVDRALQGLATKHAGAVATTGESVPHLGFDAFKDRCYRTADGEVCSGDFAIPESPDCDITPDFLHQLAAVKKLMDRTGLPLIKLLSFWGDISTSGDKSLYARLFLTHNMVGIDDAFKADQNGNYLAASAKISDHLPVVMAALKLKADAITIILGLPGVVGATSPSDAPLNLANVSLIYRYGLLAKALHLKASDLPGLTKLFGNPFANADTTLGLFDLWQKMEDAGFTFRQLSYIIQDLDDPLKPLALSQKTMLQTAKTLYDGLTAIDVANPDLKDPAADPAKPAPTDKLEELATIDLVRAKAGLVFDLATVERIVGLLEGTTVYITNAPPDQNIVVPAALAAKVRYVQRKDVNPHQASLQVTGILTDDETAAAVKLCADPDWTKAFTDRIEYQNHILFNDVVSDTIPSDKRADVEKVLLAGDVTDTINPDKSTAPHKRFVFLQCFLPFLRSQLKHRFVLESVSGLVDLSRDKTEALVSHALTGATATERAEDVLMRIQDTPSTAWYLIPPEDGDYVFGAVSLSEANGVYAKPADIKIDGASLTFTQQKDPSNFWFTSPIPKLKKGQLYKLDVSDRKPADLQWKKTGSSWTSIATSALLPDHFSGDDADAKAFKGVFARLIKAASVVNDFALSAEEVLYFQKNGQDFADFDFNAVSLKAWQRIADYAALRESLPKAGMPLLDLFTWACRPDSWNNLPDDAAKLKELSAKLDAVTKWGLDRISSLLAADHFDLAFPSNFRSEANLLKMQKAIAVADKVGVDIDRLFYWAVPGSKFWPCHAIAEDIRMGMRARFDAEDFEKAVKPLSDRLREMQKRALISFLLVQQPLKDWGVVDADSLFEFFLIDVQMGTDRETSRLVQAVASVQLFIKRCLMGLEDKYGVPADAIDRHRWEWMQKYRVWEANRKVFLYPENWIRPDLRDDKSPFYKELESELLQKDVNSQTVTEALKKYLFKVDEVANLKVVGLFYEEENELLHIFARTRHAPYFFFYRYFDNKDNAKYWYPWEKMQVDIPSYDVEEVDDKDGTTTGRAGERTGRILDNGTYLIPVVWNHRLLVFFPQFVRKTATKANRPTFSEIGDSSPDDQKPDEMWELKLAWTEYRNRKWTQKQVSSDAIYCNIFPGDRIDAYLFIPTTRNDGVVIDVVHDSDVLLTPPSQYPKLESVELTTKGIPAIKLPDGSIRYKDGKNATTTFDVSVKTSDGKTEFARALSVGYGTEYYAANDPGVTIPIPVLKKITKDKCAGFNVQIAEHPPGDDTWWFRATLTLTFAGGSTLHADWYEGKGEHSINQDDPATPAGSFVSHDLVDEPSAPPKPSLNIAQRFMFTGNQLLLSDAEPPMLYKGFRFHYNGDQLWSLQRPLTHLKEQPGYCDDGNCRPLKIFSLDRALPDSFYLTYPNAHQLLGKLNRDSLDELFQYSLAQQAAGSMGEVFGAYSNEQGQVSYDELKRPYSLYNWEVWFHAPMQLVEHLLKSQQFDQALAMCNYVFNPLAKPVAGEDITKSCWQFPPFKTIDAKNVLANLFAALKPGQPSDAITRWRENPFEPHVVARGRPSAYMKYVVMKYISILIEYGDYYFRQYTTESIPLAIQCYVMASHLYGPRGQKIPRRAKLEKRTYLSLLDKWDAFGNAMVDLELEFPFSNQVPTNVSSASVGLANIFGSMISLYFCIPDNPNLTRLRATIDDRLLKIRSCENIQGVFQQPPLFEPPIDPALLVQAAAQGLNLSAVLNDMDSPMPNYRFYYLLQKALELCTELRTLGNAFLSAKEKGDAEALAQMRAKHDTSVMNLVMEVKRQQLKEAKQSLDALEQNRKVPVSRMQYYLKLVGEDLGKVPDPDVDFNELTNQIDQPVDEGGLKLVPYEKEEMDSASAAVGLQTEIGMIEALASDLHALPTLSVDGKFLGIGPGVSFGGPNLGSAMQARARGLQIVSNLLSHRSTSAGRKASFLRQLQDRVQQVNAAGYEIKNIDKQILTQQIRIAIANQEVNNQQQQIDNAQEVEEFLRTKYTNAELYSWMEGEIRTLYRQAYNLAYDLAKKAESAYRFERPADSSSNFIQYGYWAPGRDGLLAGERLYLALKQLEAAYQEKRGYDFEITKHVSLRQINPVALLQLRQINTCEFALQEALFDMDHPGHYLRRIKSVGLTVPCVVGPYTSLNCTLRLLQHEFRTSALARNVADYRKKTDEEDDRFSTVSVPITAIAASTGQSDSGVFELNFRDERYIPFEGAGAISKWRLELPGDFHQFDYQSISDVVLHLRYTAVEGGEKLKAAAAGSLRSFMRSIDESGQEGLFAFFDLKHDFPTEWAAFVSAKDNAPFTASIRKDHFPYFAQGMQIKVQNLELYGQDVTSHRSVGDQEIEVDPTADLNGKKQAFTFTAQEDKQVLKRPADAQVFLRIQYSLS